MDSFFDIFIAILVIMIIITAFHGIITYQTPKEKEYNKKLKRSLQDEYIIDTETGVKLTLEEAESGNWLAHDNEFRTIPKEDLNKLPTEAEKNAEIAINYLRSSTYFRKTKLDANQLKILDKTKILSGYDDWSYSHSYKFEKGIIFLPAPELNKGYYYCESHIMIWMKIESIEGHYIFKEKTASERFFDLIRNDDDIKLKDYESMTLRSSNKILVINNILSKIVTPSSRK